MKALAIAAALLAAIALGAVGFVYSGLYDISATDQHLAPTYWLLDTTMKYSLKRRGANIAVPDLEDAGKIARGVSLYRAHCEHCHGAPGVAPEPFALGMTPALRLDHAYLPNDFTLCMYKTPPWQPQD